MIRKLRYVNSRGDEIVFGGDSGPWGFGRMDIFDARQEYRSTGGRVTSFAGGIRELSMAVVMRGGSASERNRFADVTAYDVRAGVPGTLWAGESFMRCWIAGFELSEWDWYDSWAVYDCTVVSDRPWWVRVVEQTLEARVADQGGGLDHPHDHPHDYSYPSGTTAVVRNPFMLPARLDIAFAGPCVSPYVVIGQNRYQVMATVERGQLLIVRGYGERDIVIRHSDGTETSAFAQGVREEGARIFAEVPPGDLPAAWSGAYNVGLTLYEERTTPWWT